MRLLIFVLLSALSTSGQAAPTERQLTLLTVNCLQCHANVHTGAPVMGDQGAWGAILAQGKQQIMTHVVEGLRGMPPLGYCSACSEDDLITLSEILAGEALQEAPR
ncbi:MAG: c-type cytochrome [Aequoribacter sp.]|jgi:cytochrome c5|uniref:c-type cytochrome n=1 Tax=Aequoribacter sp. TaxID=2847771 RepID=UPI003C52A5BD